MRTRSILLLVLGLPLAACQDNAGPQDSADPATAGTLVVSTASEGGDPDLDGYLLTVDGVDSLPLEPTGTSRIDLPAGRHTLRLLGVADHCVVAPGTTLEVGVPPQDTTSVAFEVSCPATGVRIRVTTTGLDTDLDGYRVVVDATDRGTVPANGTSATIRLDPGSRTIALADLTPNCKVDGAGSRTVTVVATEVARIEAVVVCTATSGVIGVVVEVSGTDVDGDYEAMVDGARSFFVRPGGPAYVTAVSPGDHLVSLVAPSNCSVEGDPQSVSVTAGGLIRDTVEVAFSVTCVPDVPGTLRITAPTTGPLPTAPYTVWLCQWGCFGGVIKSLGTLWPNDTLVANPEPGNYQLMLWDVPARCRVRSRPVWPSVTITLGTTVEIEFDVRCRR